MTEAPNFDSRRDARVIRLPVTRDAQDVEKAPPPAPKVRREVLAVVTRTRGDLALRADRVRSSRAMPVVKAAARHSTEGSARILGAWWRWITAADHSQALANGKGEFVEAIRERRRKIALYSAGALAAGDAWGWAQDWWAIWLPPAGAALLVMTAGGVVNAIATAKDTNGSDERTVLGTHPGSKAIRHALEAAGQLGKADDIRVIGPVTRNGSNSGWVATVEPKAGVPAAKLIKRQPEIAAAFGVGMPQVAIDPARGHNGRVTIECFDDDPLSGDPVPSPLVPRADPFDIWREKVHVGLDARGRAVKFSLIERSLLVGGEAGSGKSSADHNVLGAVALDPHARMWLIDGKGGADLLDYEQIAHRFLAEPDPKACYDVALELQEVMEDRYRGLKRAGQRKVTAENWEDLGMPLEFLHIDEIQRFTTDDEFGKKIVKVLWDLVSRGRASGIVLSAATQRPAAEVVPTLLRDILSIRWALRCTTPQASDTILGQGWAGRGYNASTIDSTQRGAGLLLAEGAMPVWLRSCFIDDNDVAAITRRAYRLRESAGTLPARESSPDVLLLKACIAACGDAEKIWTADLLDRISDDPAWAGVADDPNDPAELARRLRPLGLQPKGQDIDGTNRNGYRRSDFTEALNRLFGR
ncbi:FtsK/SpoIIIE domain-containing protein [Microbispora sp. ATCC PTA-5024]|uniref:FtsK/SpoIIIE domain-containing protein n=1 Tax=Microbispora sp. ATCC PTA-5024 TaxID=316330 RepID=UPI0003DCD054|nr:FtsK/SpoIIIE domain-containing protein [Microbispora sp. ATCC PTA-5024]ETK36098.1 cell division protein FtsK [Microbispora sp. ATCC PTA-5024]